jgi:hypothetical protein
MRFPGRITSLRGYTLNPPGEQHGSIPNVIQTQYSVNCMKTVLLERRINMKRRDFLAVLSILVVLILAMVAIVPASAEKPVHSSFEFETDIPYEGCDFALTGHLKYRAIEISKEAWTDRHLGGTTFTLNYNGHTLTARNNSNGLWTWITWYDAWVDIRGAEWFVTVPGVGPVSGIVGNQHILEYCHDEPNGDFVCEYELLEFSGMIFDKPEAICNYLLNGK